MHRLTWGHSVTLDEFTHAVSDLLGGADRLGTYGALETVSFFALTLMMAAAFALAGVLLIHVL